MIISLVFLKDTAQDRQIIVIITSGNVLPYATNKQTRWENSIVSDP
jgi:hypothetical protein